MPIVEFGTGNEGRKRGIVPSEERHQANLDAIMFGSGYLYDERRLDPAKLEVIFPADAPATLVQLMTEYFEKRVEEQPSE